MNDRLVALKITDDTTDETYVFDDNIPAEDIQAYGAAIITLNNWGFSVEIAKTVYSSETSKPLCVLIELHEDFAVTCELRRENTGKYFLYLAQIEDNQLGEWTVAEESSETYKLFFNDSCGDAVKALMAKHIENPDQIPVGQFTCE